MRFTVSQLSRGKRRNGESDPGGVGRFSGYKPRINLADRTDITENEEHKQGIGNSHLSEQNALAGDPGRE
jgi:hypothetical protein